MNKPSSHHSNSKQSRSNSLSQEEKKVKTTGPIHNPKYKLKMCENFETEGVCPYYEKCQFAHGQNELEKWTSKQRKDSLPKVQSPTQVEKKSPITPQIKSKKHLRAESDVTADSSSVVTGPTSSPFVHPNANPSNNSQQSASSPTSQASPISLDQSKSVEEGNPWFSKRNPLVQKDLMDQKKNDINPPINQKSYSSINPSKFSLSIEEKPMNDTISQPHESATSNLNTNKNSNNNSGIINTISSSSSSGIPLFDEERMIKELEKIVLEGNDNVSKPFSDTGYDIRESSMLFKNGFLQLPSFSSSPKTGETNQQGWRREVMGRSPYQDPNQFGAQSSLAQMSSYLASNNTNSSFGNFYEDLYLSNYRPVQADYSQYQYHQGQSSPYNYDQSNSHPTYENWPAYQSNFQQQQQQQQQHHQQQPMRYPQMVSMPQVPTNANRYYHP